MHEYSKFFGTNNQQKIERFLIDEKDLLKSYITSLSLLM